METKSKTKTNKASELIAFIGTGFSQHLEKHVHDTSMVSEATLDFMGWLRTEMGGQLVYFPKEFKIDREVTFSDIYDQHLHGTPVHELVRGFKLSTQTIYRAIASEREKRRLERDALEAARRQKSRDKSFERWKREGGNGDAI
ncbi:Mor transcription activator family protein [Pseudomonas putida]|uniref:Mor transcription activator family protein n=1 Tax=Pseudomonas putida TaxID=303 RepID=UPI000CD3BE3D|nr:Mor transcription activator family protein [Pseudomonas putida]